MSPIGEHARETAGFTLIELVVVLGILALVLAVGLPLLPGAADRAALRVAAGEIAAGLRETRSLALARGQSAALTLDTARRVYRIGEDTTWHTLPSNVAAELFTAAGQQLTDVAGNIRFFSDGGSTGGGIRLAQGNAEYEVRVDWLTGRVSLASPPTPSPPK